MRRVVLLLIALLGLVGAAAVGAQMVPSGGGMGGGRHTMVTLVSPASSTTQIARGVVMIGAHAGMMGGARTPTPGAGTPGGGRRLLLLLRLSGVSAGGALVTSAGNRLLFDGRLSAAGANDVLVSVDEPFSISNGSALVSVPIDLPATADATVLLIDQVSVLDAAADTIAVPGVSIVSAAPRVSPTPTRRCTTNDDCDDGDAGTRDMCTPLGCRHMRGHMGGPMM